MLSVLLPGEIDDDDAEQRPIGRERPEQDRAARLDVSDPAFPVRRGDARRERPQEAVAATAVDGVFCEGEAEPLGDGQAPWSGFSSTGGDA